MIDTSHKSPPAKEVRRSMPQEWGCISLHPAFSTLCMLGGLSKFSNLAWCWWICIKGKGIMGRGECVRRRRARGSVGPDAGGSKRGQDGSPVALRMCVALCKAVEASLSLQALKGLRHRARLDVMGSHICCHTVYPIQI